MFDISSLDYEFEQFVSHPEDLKRILQHQQQRKKLTKSKNLLTFGVLFLPVTVSKSPKCNLLQLP